VSLSPSPSPSESAPRNINTRVAPSIYSSGTPCACATHAHHAGRSTPACADEHLQRCTWGSPRQRPPPLQAQMARGSRAHTLSPAPAVPHPLQRGPPPIPRSNRKRPGLPCTHIPSPRSRAPQGLRRRGRGAKMCTRSGAVAAGCDASSCARVCTRGAARASCSLVHAHQAWRGAPTRANEHLQRRTRRSGVHCPRPRSKREPPGVPAHAHCLSPRSRALQSPR
jgi:hypothetical protein